MKNITSTRFMLSVSMGLVFMFFFSFPGLGKKKRTLNFKPLAKTTEKIYKTISSLDSIYMLEGVVGCPEFKNYAALKNKHAEACYQLNILARLKDGKNKIITFTQDCVVEDRKIVFRKQSSKILFADRIAPLDTLFEALEKEITNYYRLIKNTCLREYNECQQIKKEESNRKTLAYVKDLLKYRQWTDEEVWQDSLRLLDQMREHKEYEQSSPTAKFYNDLYLALSEELKYVIYHHSDARFCSNAHIYWTKLLEQSMKGTSPCERAYLIEHSSDRRWDITPDSAWIAHQYQQNLACILPEHRKGCTCELASNYDSEAKEPADLCKGCMDPIATNYCSYAISQGNMPCIYKACTEWCYQEYSLTEEDIMKKFPLYVAGRDQLELDSSLCITNVCGCLDPCAASYDSVKVAQGIYLRNPQPDTCKIICGCLDSLAVNYARRTEPLWARELYFNGEVTKHEPSVCVYTACKDSCSINFDPLDNPKIVADASCLCKKVESLDLDQRIEDLAWRIADSNNSIEVLNGEFLADNPALKLNRNRNNVVFFRKGDDLEIVVDVKKMKARGSARIETTTTAGGIPLGEYNFKEVNDIIDAVLVFLTKKSSLLGGKAMRVLIVGEADGHPIRNEGITFENAGNKFEDVAFRVIDAATPTSVDYLTSTAFDASPNQSPFHISEGTAFTDNITLALLRAYMVRQKVKAVRLPSEETLVLLGAKANPQKGDKYRRVTTVFTIQGFYHFPEGEEEILTGINKTHQELVDAKRVYEQYGFPDGVFMKGIPTGQNQYAKCPCYE